MKLFLKIFGAVIALFAVFLIALSFYLTDERLKELILPTINEMTGREVQVERMSYTLFRTFPSFGLVIQGFDLPDTESPAMLGSDSAEHASIARVQELVLVVDLFPLLSGNLSVSRLDINDPLLRYVVFEDGTTNLDSLLAQFETAEDQPQAEASTAQIDLEAMRIRGAEIVFQDFNEQTDVRLSGLEAEIAISLGEFITTDVDARVAGLSVVFGGDRLLTNLPFSLSQRSVLDLAGERVTIESGRLNIRGLDLDLEGVIADYTSEAMLLELAFSSSSDDFGALLELVPDAFKEDLQGVETRGSLVLSGQVNGRLGEDLIPDFEIVIGVDDGFIRYPGVASAIEEINIRIEARNERVVIERFSAIADINSLSASGFINNPLEDSADFDLAFDLDLDLATIRNFYPVDEFELEGKMTLNGTASGLLADAENARFNAALRLENGLVRYMELDEPVRDINVVLTATQQLVTIESFAARAAENTLSASGTIREPLNEDRTRFDFNASIFADLGSIPRFYPIDEDTLRLRGIFRFDGTASGLLADIENASVNGNLSLREGSVHYHLLPKPLDTIGFEASITRERIRIASSTVRTGTNNFTANGDINDYLTDAPRVNLTVAGEFNLGELPEFADLQPYISEIAGRANVDLRVTGPPMTPEDLRFNGLFRLTDFSVAGDSLPQPVSISNANMVFSQEHVELRRFEMMMGSSDFNFTGELRNYMRLIDDSTPELATLNATFRSNLLHVDEIYEWEPLPPDAEPEPFPIHLPRLVMNMDVEIGELIFLGVPIRSIAGRVNSTDTEIRILDAVAQVFGGNANGNLIWEVPDPENTKITFNGALLGLTAEDFFREVKPAGMEDLHEYFSGTFSTTIEYFTEMDVFLDPVIPSMRSNGSFSMERTRMRNHPTQIQVADLLRSPELRDLRLDDLNSSFTIENSVMTLRDLNLTSADIGVELNGTQHLETGALRYSTVVVLPGRFGQVLEPVITRDGVRALTREDGNIPVPLLIRGTTESPQVRPDTEEITRSVADFLRDAAGDAVRNTLRNLFGN
ncbi:MAG: AsmA family protein [Balneolales bacterium]|nr:AsmA family protein [Balneolales bacterium]